MTDVPVGDEEVVPLTLVTRQDDYVSDTIFLSLSGIVILLAFFLRVEGEAAVVVPWINIALPGTCSMKQLTGIDCPGCGLTRCFVSLAHGDFARAWHFHPVGMFFFAFVVTQIPYRIWQIQRLRHFGRRFEVGWLGFSPLLVIAGAMMLQWLVRLFGRS